MKKSILEARKCVLQQCQLNAKPGHELQHKMCVRKNITSLNETVKKRGKKE